jgi:hypothetical protein
MRERRDRLVGLWLSRGVLGHNPVVATLVVVVVVHSATAPAAVVGRAMFAAPSRDAIR